MSLYQGQSIVNELETETETKTRKSKSHHSDCTVVTVRDAMSGRVGQWPGLHGDYSPMDVPYPEPGFFLDSN